MVVESTTNHSTITSCYFCCFCLYMNVSFDIINIYNVSVLYLCIHTATYFHQIHKFVELEVHEFHRPLPSKCILLSIYWNYIWMYIKDTAYKQFQTWQPYQSWMCEHDNLKSGIPFIKSKTFEMYGRYLAHARASQHCLFWRLTNTDVWIIKTLDQLLGS